MSNWPFITTGTITSANQEMVQELLKRQDTNITVPEAEEMKALGLAFEQRRYQFNLTRTELSQMTGLATGFLCMLETGQLLPSDITNEVIQALPWIGNGGLT